MNIWKGLTFFLLIINVGLILSFVWLYDVGTASMENEKKCSFEICFNHQESNGYYYEPFDNICTCYNGDKVVYQEVIE